MNKERFHFDPEPSDIDEIACLLSPNNVLINWLLNTAIRRKHSIQYLCAELDVPFSYLLALAKGSKRTQDITSEFATRCAEYIEPQTVPVICVKIAAGQIRLEDFEPACVNEEHHYEALLEDLREDRLIAGLVPQSLFSENIPHEIKRFVAFLWGEVTGRDTLDTRWLPNILKNVRAACAVSGRHSSIR
jgi:hypothetical protein